MLCNGSVIPFDKPLEWTSFDVIKYFRIAVKKRFGLKKLKIGHAGTLDPLATGLLLLCTGRSTKIIESLMGADKCYEATVRFGATTASFDREHPEDAHYPWEHITESALKEVIASSFIGRVQQVPPLYSALSIDGKRAYKLARKGSDLELPSREIEIQSIEILDFQLPDVRLKIQCGKGTYIRSIARDLGVAMDSGAYLTALRRTQVGSINVSEAIKKEELDELLDNGCLDLLD